MRRRQLVGVVGLSLTGLLLACGGGGGNGPFPISNSEPVITSGLVPQSFPVDQPVSVSMRQWGNTRVQISEGQKLTMTVEAQGTAPLIYGWRFNGRIIDGETSPRLIVDNLKPSNLAMIYTVSVSNGIGRADSAAVYVTVLPKASP